MVRRLRRNVAALCAVGLLTVLAAACSTSGPNSVGSVTVAAVPGIDNVPLYLAQKDGLFSRAGIGVTIKRYPTVSAEIRALNSGQVQVAVGDYAEIFYNQTTGSGNFSLLADGYDATPGVAEVLTTKNSGITSPADLAEKKIAVPSTNKVPEPTGTPISLLAAALESVLRSYEVNISTIQFEPMPPQQELAALSSGSVQAILVPEPYVYEAESSYGAVEVLDPFSGAYSGLPMTGYFTDRSWPNANSAAAAAFRSAILQAQGEADVTGPVQRVLPSYLHISRQTADLVTVGSYPTSDNVNRLQLTANLLYNQGMIKPLVVARMLAG